MMQMKEILEVFQPHRGDAIVVIDVIGWKRGFHRQIASMRGEGGVQREYIRGSFGRGVWRCGGAGVEEKSSARDVFTPALPHPRTSAASPNRLGLRPTAKISKKNKLGLG